MKLPKIFIPNKSLDTKIKNLKESGSIEITLETLKENDGFILYGGTKFPDKDKIIENAIHKIIKNTYENKIKWEEDPKLYGYKAKATVLNYKDKPITISIVFEMSKDMGYLYLGDRKGPCKNTFHKKVKQLAIEYFKMNPRDLL